MPNGVANGFLDSLSVSDFHSLLPFLTTEKLAWKTVLVEPGAAAQFVYFPDGAVLSVLKLLRDGRSVEVNTIGRESAYGLMQAIGQPVSFNRVIVQIGGASQKISAAELRRLAHANPSLLESVVGHLQISAAQAEQSVACNALHSVEQRLSRWLLMTQDRTDGEKLELTQEFLGLMLGVQRTTVTGAARTFQDRDWIDYRRGQIRILDRPALLRAACECYAANREDTERVLRR